MVAKSKFNEEPHVLVLDCNAGPVPLECSILQELSRPTESAESKIFEAKEAFFAELLNTLREDITNMDQLNAVKNHYKTIKPMLESIKSAQTTSRQSNLRDIDRTPANANICKQRKFISIKRKIKQKTLQCSSQAETNELALQLMTRNR